MSVSLIGIKSVQQELIPTMANWRGGWDANTAYFYGDIVQGTDNNGYACMVPNTGNDPVGGALPTPWVALASSGASGGMNFTTVWSGSTSYIAEDVVLGANGATYIALSNNSNVNPVVDVSGAMPGVSGSKWSRLSGANVITSWSGSSQYGVGDMVQATLPNAQVALFQSLVPNSNSQPAVGNSNWLPVSDEPGSAMSYIGTWSNSVAYDKQDVVDLSGFAFVSRVNNNSNVAPSLSGTNANWVALSGSNSIPEIHFKTSQPNNNYCAPNGIASNTWSNILTFPNTAQSGETGTFVLNSHFGIGGSNQGTWTLQVSDVSGAVPSGNAFFSTPASGSNAYGGLTPLSGTMNYSFSSAPATLFVNVSFGNDNGGATYTPGATATGYSYTNTITPTLFIADP
jgi:hypothetical protein